MLSREIISLKTILHDFLVRFLVRIRFYPLLFFILYREADKIGSNIRVLVLAKTGSVEDLEAIRTSRLSNSFGYLVISRRNLGILASCFLSKSQQTDLLKESDFLASEHESYKSLIRHFMKYLKLRHNISVLFESNWIYWNSRDWHPVAEELGIRTVIMLKEGWSSSFLMSLLTEKLTQIRKYEGSKVLVINQATYESQLNTMKVTEDQLNLVGLPRLDHLMQLNKRERKPETKVVFFVPDLDLALIETPESSEFLRFFQSLTDKTILEFVRLAESLPSVSFEIKTKVTHSTQMMVKSLLDQNFVPPLPKNLQLTFGGLAGSSLLKSDLVISYHSTALIECLLVGVQVFVPQAYVECGWDEYIHQYDGLLPTFCDFKEIEDAIVELNRNNTGENSALDKSKRSTFLERSVGNPDGLAGLRAYEILQDYLR